MEEIVQHKKSIGISVAAVAFALGSYAMTVEFGQTSHAKTTETILAITEQHTAENTRLLEEANKKLSNIERGIDRLVSLGTKTCFNGAKTEVTRSLCFE